ncbi:MAG TPA: IS607 family transposase [Phototrophicaceae bacterium]|nr:IS607 family transposase [Phototrophicaceae bacterium]
MYTPAEFAKKIGVTVHTLQRWDREGRLVAKRTHTNRRYYTDDDLPQVLGQLPEPSGRTVVYCRVSNAAQQPDLARQRQLLEQFCAARGLAVDEWIEEIGGGLNFKRQGFLALIDRILAREIGTLVIAHQDRLVRFGFPLIEHICNVTGCQLIVMNTESLSPPRELIEDLLIIVQGFSSRVPGLRHIQKMLTKTLKDGPPASDSA